MGGGGGGQSDTMGVVGNNEWTDNRYICNNGVTRADESRRKFRSHARNDVVLYYILGVRRTPQVEENSVFFRLGLLRFN